jgi:hypothetical protein
MARQKKMHRLGQSASEFTLMLAVLLAIALAAIIIAGSWPDISTETQKRQSDAYWRSALPFSVKFHAIKPDNLVMELQNADAITLNVTEIRINNVRLDFFNHSLPYSEPGEARCSGGSCSMLMRPGERQIISTENFTTNPANPCGFGENFAYGTSYKISLAIVYRGTSSDENYTQQGAFKLIGTCGGMAG